MSPSALMEKELLVGKGSSEEMESMLPCVVVFGGKTSTLSCRISGG